MIRRIGLILEPVFTLSKIQILKTLKRWYELLKIFFEIVAHNSFCNLNLISKIECQNRVVIAVY